MLSKGNSVEQVEEKSNVMEATSPLITLLKAIELADHEGNGLSIKKKINNIYVDMYGVREEACNLST